MAKSSTADPTKTAEALRLDEASENGVQWRQWGPYLSERQWGTVREDYSEDGNAWDYFTHIKPAHAPIIGVRTVSPVSAMKNNDCALPLHCGMAKTRF
jgi:hypothetical protein